MKLRENLQLLDSFFLSFNNETMRQSDVYFQSYNAPLTEDQLDEVMTRLDADGDGEVDLG